MVLSWVIQPKILLNKPSYSLINDIEKLGHKVVLMDYEPIERKFIHISDEIINEKDAVILYGSIQFNREFLKSRKNKITYSYGFNQNITSIDCMTFAPLNYFLNSDYIILPYAHIDHNWNKLNLESDIFIRPVSMFKPFTGFSPKSHSDYLSVMRLSHIASNELSIISSRKNIDLEARFVICDSKPISWSSYNWNNEIVKETPNEMVLAAEKIARIIENKLDFIYTLDLCISDGNIKIVELNSFSSAGLYNCDTGEIAKKISEFTIKEHLTNF